MRTELIDGEVHDQLAIAAAGREELVHVPATHAPPDKTINSLRDKTISHPSRETHRAPQTLIPAGCNMIDTLMSTDDALKHGDIATLPASTRGSLTERPDAAG